MSDFKRQIDQELGVITKEAGQATVNAALYGWNLVTADTPVRTGRARASWLLTVSEIRTETKPKTHGHLRIYEDPPTPEVKFDISKDRFIFITNNVEYIEFLEHGTNGMSPYAMVARNTPKIYKKLGELMGLIK